ncbi:MAG: hypothetical protein ACYC3N_10635 [Halothiobacillus sp.]
MSEFTAGLLYHSANDDKLAPLLDELGFINDHDVLNDAWHVATLDIDACTALSTPENNGWPDEQGVHAQLLGLSRAAPLLFFYNAEDHGWGYRILSQGRETARFDLNYEADYQIAEGLLKASHPGQDIHQVCTGEEWEVAHQQARANAAYLAQLRQGRAAANQMQFSVFGIPKTTLAELDTLLSESSLLAALAGEEFHDPVERFKLLLGIEEMSWLS